MWFILSLQQVRWVGSNHKDCWEPEENVPQALREKFEKGEESELMTVWDESRMYGMTNVRAYQVLGNVQTPSKRRKTDTNDMAVR